MNAIEAIDFMWGLEFGDDGPLNGICKYDGEVCFFYIDKEYGMDVRNEYQYNVIPLTFKQSFYEQFRRLCFELMVIRCPFTKVMLWFHRNFRPRSDMYLSQGIDPIGYFRK